MALEATDVIKNIVKRLRALETSETSSVTPLLFADLPAAGIAGRLRMVTNGRKAAEGAGAGTGVLVFDDGSSWIAVDSGLPVTV